MPSLFNPRLVNSPFGDPGLFVPFFYNRRALLFDMGDISAVSPRDLLKITHCFVSHTHMDHFIGFDHLVRLMLGREIELHLYGPAGFHKNVEGKLSGYTWNLVENYDTPLALVVTEVLEDRLVTKRYDCKDRFQASDQSVTPYSPPLLYSEKSFYIDAVILDHDIPCLGFAINEHYRVNIRKEMLREMNLKPGKWLFDFKQMIYGGLPLETPVHALYGESGETREFSLGELSEKLVIVREGGKIVYITDVVGTRSNIDRIVALAKNCDHLFIEATFLEKDRSLAKQKRHLTAKQAGTVAAAAGAGRFTIFHFSPRYTGNEEALEKEAMEAFTFPPGTPGA